MGLSQGRGSGQPPGSGQALEKQRAVGTTKAKIIFQGKVDGHIPCCVGAVVKIALWVLIEDVDGRRADLVVQGEHREHRLDSPAPPSKCPVMDLVELTTNFSHGRPGPP